MSYEEDKRDAVPGFEEDYEPEQQTLDVWMDLPEPEIITEEEDTIEPEQEPAPDIPEFEFEQIVMPEYTAQSESELADVIAQAVATSFHGEPEFMPESQSEEPAELEDAESEPAGDAESEPQKASGEAAAPATEEPEESPEKDDAQEPEEKKPDPPQLKSPLTAKKPKKEVKPIYRPARKVKKIPKGTVRDGMLKSLTQTLEEIRTRQREDLPDNSASLKAAERNYSKVERVYGMLNPIRTVILVLMLMALMGRRFSWMLLGFLGGETGVFAALILTVIAVGACWRTVVSGVRDAAYLRFSYESLLLVTTVLSAMEAVSTRNSQTLLPLLTIGWCLSGMSDLMNIRSRLRSLRSVLGRKNRTAVRVRRNLWEHMDCIGKAPAGNSGFVRHLEERDSWHTGWSIFSMFLLALCLITGAYLSARTGNNYLSVLVTLLTVSMPVAAAMTGARSFSLLSGVLGRSGVLAGWYGAKMLSGRKTVLAYDSDLFPAGTISRRGVRVYGNQTAQLLVSYGASLVFRADNSLSEPFYKLLQETGGQVHHVSRFQVTEGGLSGQIHGVTVAVGTYSFMQLMGTMPPKDAPKNGLFIALNGQIAGLFAIRYRVKAGSASGFARFVQQPRLTPLAAMKHLSVNPSYMKTWFKIPVGEIICPKVNTRWKLADPSRFSRGIVCGYLMAEGITAYSRLVAGARRMHTMGWVMTAGSIVSSLALFGVTVSGIANGTELISAGRLLLIQAFTFLVVEGWSRHVIR